MPCATCPLAPEVSKVAGPLSAVRRSPAGVPDASPLPASAAANRPRHGRPAPWRYAVKAAAPLELHLIRRLFARARDDRMLASYLAYGFALAVIAVVGVEAMPLRPALDRLCDAIPLFRGLANASSDPAAYRTYFGVSIVLAMLQTPVVLLEMARRQRRSGRNGWLPSLLVCLITLPFVVLILVADIPVDFTTVEDASQGHRTMARLVLSGPAGLAIAGSFLLTALLVVAHWALTPVTCLMSSLTILGPRPAPPRGGS